ncbi:hypothetical protein [Hymenobacter crusticola]|uniref:Uncharacterized protein n=1 Tax=Hymenobacter crusticola TaxID=1770526 RepID=A0A243WK16_9BACT|nr:hypothetical protein [Hymenobacter crusticola]OUJ75949.1 hypothetical protein BXP70_01285 [Hymenobacter crusticola]
MRLSFLFLAFAALVGAPAVAQQVRRTANGYHHTRNTKAKARSGAYARYDRSARRNEDNLKLAPGLRLNMPSPPTTDYMGRPLKKKAAPATAGATSLSAEKSPAKASSTAAPATKRRTR